MSEAPTHDQRSSQPEPGLRESTSPRGTRPNTPRQLGVAALGLIAALSILGSRAPIGEDGGAGVSVRPAGAFDSAWVASELRHVNPTLSSRELERIGAAVMRCSERHDLDPVLVTAVLRVESGARPWVRSPKGATGLMQVMPHMFGPLDVAGNLTTIESNIEVGCLILADNIRRLGEDDGILAYFWGSEIRGDKYLERVRAARAALRAPRETES